MEIEALSISKICNPLGPVQVDFHKNSHLQGLTLADSYPRGSVQVDVLIGVRARSDLGGRRPVCPKKLRSAPLLDCRNQLFTPSKCTKKHAFTIVERHKIVRNRNTVFRTSHTLCRFTRSSNDRVTKQATRSSN